MGPDGQFNTYAFDKIFRHNLDINDLNVHMHIMASKPQIRKTRDVTDVTACTCFNLRKASRAMTQLYDAALKPAGIRANQFNVLAALEILGEVAQSDLAAALVMDRTTLIRNLAPLVSGGLVTAERPSGNGPKIIALSAAGNRVLQDAKPLWQGVQERIAGILGLDKWNGLIGDLEAAVEAAHA